MWFCLVLVIFCKFTWAAPLLNGSDTEERGIDWPEPNRCLTPDNQLGTCKTIRTCDQLMSLINRSEEPIRLYLRQSFCGREARTGVPKVCCAKSIEPATPRVFQDAEFTTPPTMAGEPGHRFECGRSNKTVWKIVAGKEAELGDWPWMAALQFISNVNANEPPKYKCGGSLISNDWVVTAAHCFDRELTLVSVRLGDLNTDDNVIDYATPIDVGVADVVTHPQYTASPPVNDIALVRLKRPVTFTDLIHPICILGGEPQFRSDGFYQSKRPFIVGWGRLYYRGPQPTALQEAQIDIVDNERCAQSYSDRRAVIDERVLCAGGGGKDSCGGDSGGPMIIPIKRTYYLAGIVSFGVGCANPDYPGVYTRVAQFTQWISEVTKLQI